MTTQEHALMICMFTRMYALLGIMTEALKREGLWSEDDQKAYQSAFASDRQQWAKFYFQAIQDYQECAEKMGVPTSFAPPSIVP